MYTRKLKELLESLALKGDTLAWARKTYEKAVFIGEHELDHGRPLVDDGCLTHIIRAVDAIADGNLEDGENMTNPASVSDSRTYQARRTG